MSIPRKKKVVYKIYLPYRVFNTLSTSLLILFPIPPLMSYFTITNFIRSPWKWQRCRSPWGNPFWNGNQLPCGHFFLFFSSRFRNPFCNVFELTIALSHGHNCHASPYSCCHKVLSLGLNEAQRVRNASIGCNFFGFPFFVVVVDLPPSLLPLPLLHLLLLLLVVMHCLSPCVLLWPG